MPFNRFVDMQPLEAKYAYRYEILDANGVGTGQYMYLKYAPGQLVATPTPLNKSTFDPIIERLNNLANVDNTSDLNKPISTATQNALNLKANKSELFSKNYNDLTNKPTIPTSTSQLTNDSGYLTKVSKGDLGLGNVDNTADASKSVKYATSAGSATNDSSGNNISTTYQKKSTRLFEANPYSYTNGVKSFNVSSYLNSKGFFRVVVLDSAAPDTIYYMTVELVALEGSSRKTDASSSVITYVEIKNGVLQLSSIAQAKSDYIMSIDYFEVK